MNQPKKDLPELHREEKNTHRVRIESSLREIIKLEAVRIEETNYKDFILRVLLGYTSRNRKLIDDMGTGSVLLTIDLPTSMFESLEEWWSKYNKPGDFDFSHLVRCALSWYFRP